jgi:hypothetical protein
MPQSSKVHTTEIRQITMREQRRITAKLLLDMISIFSERLTPRSSSHLDTFWLGLAVYHGCFVGRPYTTPMLVKVLKMKKSTVQDRLNFLLQHNYIEKDGHHWRIPPTLERRPIADIPRAMRLIRAATRELDTLGL